MSRYKLKLWLLGVLLGLSSLHGYAYDLEEGHCVISSPAVYSVPEGELWADLCYLEEKESDRYGVVLLNTPSLRSLMEIAWEESNKVSIGGRVEAGMASLSVSGEGRLIDDNTIIGIIRSVSWNVPFDAQVKSGQWHLRPATEKEISRALLERLNYSARLNYDRMEPDSIQELHNLGSSETKFQKRVLNGVSGHMHVEKGRLQNLLQSNTVAYDPSSHRYAFSNDNYLESLPDDRQPITISSDVGVEHHEISIKTMKDLGVIDENTPKEDIEHIRQQIKQSQAATESKRREREARISADVSAFNINIPVAIGLILIGLIAGIVAWIVIRRRRR